MSWERVFILAQIMDWGFNIIVSDVDVAWLRDPLPFLEEHAHADMLWSHDGVWTRNAQGDAGLEVDGNVSLAHIPDMVAAGADILVAGTSSVYMPGASRADNVRLTREAIAKGLERRHGSGVRRGVAA
jgi:hypothetical protein